MDAEAGTYEVVLEAPAVATMLEYLSYAGFGAKQVIEGESFLVHKGGQDVAASTVTVADDVWAGPSVGLGFDFEGVPKKRVAVIDGGRATEPVTDLRTARKLGGASTGHYSGSSEFGPYAANVVLESGDSSLEDLIGGVKSGLLVTRFHYVNILDRPSTLLTGMTRDGTFRVEDGEIVGAVHNLRFTQSVLDALASVEAIGSDLAAFAPEFGGVRLDRRPGPEARRVPLHLHDLPLGGPRVHEIWHIAVLASTLLGAAGLMITLLAPLLFDPIPPGLVRARPFVLGGAAVAGVILAVEWLGVH